MDLELGTGVGVSQGLVAGLGLGSSIHDTHRRSAVVSAPAVVLVSWSTPELPISRLALPDRPRQAMAYPSAPLARRCP